MRHPIERDLGDQDGGDVLHVGGAPHHLDVVDHCDQEQEPEENGDDRADEAHSEIAPERAGHHCVCPAAAAVRRDSPSASALMVLVMNAGGSMMRPRRIAQVPKTKVTASATYGITRAIGRCAPIMVPTKPMPRSKETASAALMNDMVRLCRVVRGAPRYAKVITRKASG